ncbi:MAD2L1-binding protein [Thrips palmi]|uniref:MAD2L1-binding protein n=1 Tax=Thrips palmi TaxID=161013 RepID=A0A6P8YM20_THRPL|nr:MAD2L1-binding protein [Thrips palmi]
MSSPILINVELKDALTASSCSHLAVEFFKHIAYQRQQIPFPYKQLKSVLSRKIEQDSSTVTGARSCQAENEFIKVKGMFESMQNAFQNLEEELCSHEGMIQEIAMILGATPLSPRDVYRFQFPPLLLGHLDSKHPHQSNLLSLFRCLISSEDLHSFFKQPLSPTNMFLFIRKNNTILATSAFTPKERYNLPTSGKHAIIRLIPPSDPPKCICGGTNIYSDDESDTGEVKRPIDNNEVENCSSLWFQAHQTLKGFKDVKINGVAASTMWLQSR